MAFKNSSEVSSGSNLLSSISLGRIGVRWFRNLTALMADVIPAESPRPNEWGVA